MPGRRRRGGGLRAWWRLAVAEEEFQKPLRRNTTVEVMAEATKSCPSPGGPSDLKLVDWKAVHRRFVSGLKQHLAGEPFREFS